MTSRRPLTTTQRWVLGAAFVPMLATGIAGGVGTFSNVSSAYGKGTALGAVAAGEGATAVLALVLLGLTMLGQTSPFVVRAGLWALPAAASAMAAMAAPDSSRAVIYAITPMGMCVAAEGMAFLARRIVVHQDGRDIEADRKAASVVQALAYHRARAANHPDANLRAESERESWKLAQKVGAGDTTLASRLMDVQRERVTDGADTALGAMFAVTATATPVTETVTPIAAPVTPDLTATSMPPALEGASTDARDTEGTQVSAQDAPPAPSADTATAESVTPVTPPVTEARPAVTAATLEELAAVAGVPTPVPGERLTDEQLVVVLRHLRYRDDPPLSYRQAGTDFRDAGFVGSEQRVRRAWGALLSHEEANAAEVGETEKDQ
ncbi:hypothetical protein [Streptomyces noursei]|uniref:Conjugal transfer protein n=1 Tax=Streptomyces noursei TaxID=1971 RepID=A0A2N8PQA4_STRNR|nr:hypothetical protein [Streptomyces noursei]PNE43188.1 hypothetical protein AOB60_13370 [Streptomyces noursei]